MLALLDQVLNRRAQAARELQQALRVGIDLIAHKDVAICPLVDLLQGRSIFSDQHIDGNVRHKIASVWAWERIHFTLVSKILLNLSMIFYYFLYEFTGWLIFFSISALYKYIPHMVIAVVANFRAEARSQI